MALGPSSLTALGLPGSSPGISIGAGSSGTDSGGSAEFVDEFVVSDKLSTSSYGDMVVLLESLSVSDCVRNCWG